MAIEAEARVVLRGGGEARRALNGVSRARSDAAQAAKKAAQEEKRAALDMQRAKERAEKAAQSARQATERESKRAAKSEEREAKRALDYITEAHRKSVIERIKMEERATKAAAREAAKRLREEKKTLEAQKKANEEYSRKGRAFLGGVVGGALGGAYGASRTARSIGGIKSLPERIQAANEFRERLTITGSQAGLSADERAGVESKINAVSKTTGKDQGELLGVLETGQAQFNDLRFFADNLQEIATIARASGTDTADLAKALGYAKQAFGLTGDEAMEAAKLMVAGAAKGSIEVKDFATSFASVMGLFAENTGLKGLEGVRQLIGTAQAAGTLGKTPDATATLVERLIASLGESDVKTKLKQNAGIDVKDKTMGQIIKEMANSKKFSDPKVRETIFGKGDILTNQAITALVAAFKRVENGVHGAVDIDTIAGVRSRTAIFGKDGKQTGWKDTPGVTQGGVSAAEGAAQTAKTFADLEGSGALAFDRQNAAMQENTLQHLDEWNGQLLKVNEVSMKLETSLGSLAVWSDAIAASGVGGALGGMAAGGGGGGGGGGVLTGIGEGLSKFGPAGAILGGGALIAGALVKAGVGDAIGGFFADLFEDDKVTEIKNRGKGDVKVTADTPGGNVVPIRPAPAGGAVAAANAGLQQQREAANLRLVKESEKQTKLLEQIAANGKPAPFRENTARAPR